MKNRNFRMFLEDILLAIAKIQKYTSDMSYDHFIQNELVFDAVIRNLEVIGEATRHIPVDIKDKYWKSHGDEWLDYETFLSMNILGLMN